MQRVEVAAYRITGAAEAAPESFLLFPIGRGDSHRAASGGDRPWLVDEAAARQVIAAFQRLGRDVVIDYQHSTMIPEERPADGTAPAAGWITALQWQPDAGIVAQVKWTDKAAAMLAAGEYRYHSPVFVTDEDDRVAELYHVALTNDPATLDIQPIAASRYATSLVGRPVAAQQGAGPMEKLLQMLGLDADAGLEEIGAAITEENLATIAAMLGLPPEATREDVLGAIGPELLGTQPGKVEEPTEEPVNAFSRAYSRHFALQLARELNLKANDDFGKVVAAARSAIAAPPNHVHKAKVGAMAEEIKALTGQVDELRARNDETEFEAIVTSAAHQGKIPPSVKGAYFNIFRSDRATFDQMLEAMPQVMTGTTKMGPTGEPVTDGRAAYTQKLEQIVAERKVDRMAAIQIMKKEFPELRTAYLTPQQ